MVVYMAEYNAKQFLTSFDKKPVTTSDELLFHILDLTQSSHAPIYVIDGEKYKGVVSVFQSLMNSANVQQSTKVSSHIIHTPRLTKDSTLYEIIGAMLTTRLYELPIIEKDKIIGVVTVKSIFSALHADPVILEFLAECIDYRDPITHTTKGTVGDIIPVMKNENVSRVVLTDSHGVVEGIVSRADVREVYMQPVDRQRFRGPTEDSRTTFFDDEDKERNTDPIERFMKTDVVTLPDTTEKKEVIKFLLTSKTNSVVLVNKLNKPVGFLSTKDILHCLGAVQPAVESPIIIKKPEDSVTDTQLDSAEKKIQTMVKKLTKIRPIEKTECVISVQKFSNQKPALFKTQLQVSFPGNNAIASSEDKLFIKSITDTIQDIEKQFLKTTKKN